MASPRDNNNNSNSNSNNNNNTARDGPTSSSPPTRKRSGQSSSYETPTRRGFSSSDSPSPHYRGAALARALSASRSGTSFNLGSSGRHRRPRSRHSASVTPPHYAAADRRPSRPSLLSGTDTTDHTRSPAQTHARTPTPSRDARGLTNRSLDLVQAAIHLSQTRSDGLPHGFYSPGSVLIPPSKPLSSATGRRSASAQDVVPPFTFPFGQAESISPSPLPPSGTDQNPSPVVVVPGPHHPSVRQPSGPVSISLQGSILNPDVASTSPSVAMPPVKISSGTTERAKIFRDYMELRCEYFRLLDSLPPLEPRPSDTASSPGTSPRGLSYRQYNPLQAIRNRGARKGPQFILDPGPEQWEDVERVKTWVKTVGYASTKPSFYTSLNVSLPEFSEHKPPRADSRAGRDCAYELQLRDWSIHPAELLADQYWLEQGLHKAKIVDQKGRWLFPNAERDLVSGSGHGSVSSRQTNLSVVVGPSTFGDVGLQSAPALPPGRSSIESGVGTPDTSKSRVSHNPITRVLSRTKSTFTAPFRHRSSSVSELPPDRGLDGGTTTRPLHVDPGTTNDGSDLSHDGAISSPASQLVPCAFESTGDLISPRTLAVPGGVGAGAGAHPSLLSGSLSHLDTEPSLEDPNNDPSSSTLRRSASQSSYRKPRLHFRLKSSSTERRSVDGPRPVLPSLSDSSDRDRSDGWPFGWRPGSVSRRLTVGRRMLGFHRRDTKSMTFEHGDSESPVDGQAVTDPHHLVSSPLHGQGRKTVVEPGSITDDEPVGHDFSPAFPPGPASPEKVQRVMHEFPRSSAIQTSAIAEADEHPDGPVWGLPPPSLPPSSTTNPRSYSPRRRPNQSSLSSLADPPRECIVDKNRNSNSNSAAADTPAGLGWKDRFGLMPGRSGVLTCRDVYRMEAFLTSTRIRAQAVMRRMTTAPSRCCSDTVVADAVAVSRSVDALIARAAPASSPSRPTLPPSISSSPFSPMSIPNRSVAAAVSLHRSLVTLESATRLRLDQGRSDIESHVETFSRFRHVVDTTTIPLAGWLMDEITHVRPLTDSFARELTTLDNAVDRLLRARRRRFVWVRHGAYSGIEWGLLVLMWLIWIVVMAVRSVCAVFGLGIHIVKWLFWLS